MTNEERQAVRDECFEDVKGPGKFEGEESYSPYFYGKIIDGCADESWYFGEGEPEYDAIVVSDDDRDIFPELEGVYAVVCYETEQGFFYCIPETEHEYKSECFNLDRQQQEAGEREENG